MLLFRWLPQVTGTLLGLVQAAPLLGLLVAVLVDRGPAGDARLSSHVLPLVLWFFDEFAWTCARNSLVFATVVSIAALILGVGLRCQIGQLRSWRASSLAGTATAVLAASPAFMALGLIGLLGRAQAWPWPFSTPALERGSTSLESWRGLSQLFVWIWATLPAAVAWVWLAIDPPFDRLEPSWSATARLAGAGWGRIWRDLTWPIVRPAAARAAAQVFVFSLFEPGAPLVLGLRRTLAYQIVDAAGEPDPFPRAATWAVMTGLFAVAGWVVGRWRGGNPVVDDRRGDVWSVGLTPPHPTRPVSPRAMLAILSLAAWSLFAWMPLIGLVRMTLGGGMSAGASGDASLVSLLDRLRTLGQPPVPELAFNSVLFGLAVACGLSLISWLVSADGQLSAQLGPRARWRRPSFALPALVQGMAVLAIPWLAALASTCLLDDGWPNISRVFGNVAAVLDPGQPSWIPMALAVGLYLLPWLLRSRQGQALVVPARARGNSALEAAILAGSSRWRARALSKPDRGIRAMGGFVLVWALAATNVTPALLFLSPPIRPTVGPGILILANHAGEGPSQAAALALGAIVVNIAALAIARATSALPAVGSPD